MKSKGLLDRHDSFLKNYSDSAQDGPLLLLEASLNSLAPNKKKRRKMIVASHHYLPLENIWKRNSTHFSRKSFQEISSHQKIVPGVPYLPTMLLLLLLTVLRSMNYILDTQQIDRQYVGTAIWRVVYFVYVISSLTTIWQIDWNQHGNSYFLYRLLLLQVLRLDQLTHSCVDTLEQRPVMIYISYKYVGTYNKTTYLP